MAQAPSVCWYLSTFSKSCIAFSPGGCSSTLLRRGGEAAELGRRRAPLQWRLLTAAAGALQAERVSSPPPLQALPTTQARRAGRAGRAPRDAEAHLASQLHAISRLSSFTCLSALLLPLIVTVACPPRAPPVAGATRGRTPTNQPTRLSAARGPQARV